MMLLMFETGGPGEFEAMLRAPEAEVPENVRWWGA